MGSPNRTDDIDLTMMYVMHDAMRRDLVSIARGAARTGDDPARLHAANFGWKVFVQFITVHHRAEDSFLWPRMRQLVADRPSELALLDAMEAEHSRIDPLIESVEAAFADPEHGHERLGDLADALAGEVSGHLQHEENDALPLVSAFLPAQEWLAFGEEQRKGAPPDMAAKYLPWLIDGAAPERVEGVLQILPPQLKELYYTAWRPAYVQANPWSAEHGVTGPLPSPSS
jgi:hemerythrin-like domain-containing protein